MLRVKTFGLAGIVILGLFVEALPIEAQQVTKVPRIGFISFNTRSSELPRVSAFQQGLREGGYVEGQNINVEYRYAEPMK